MPRPTSGRRGHSRAWCLILDQSGELGDQVGVPTQLEVEHDPLLQRGQPQLLEPSALLLDELSMRPSQRAASPQRQSTMQRLGRLGDVAARPSIAASPTRRWNTAGSSLSGVTGRQYPPAVDRIAEWSCCAPASDRRSREIFVRTVTRALGGGSVPYIWSISSSGETVCPSPQQQQPQQRPLLRRPQVYLTPTRQARIKPSTENSTDTATTPIAATLPISHHCCDRPIRDAGQPGAEPKPAAQDTWGHRENDMVLLGHRAGSPAGRRWGHGPYRSARVSEQLR